MVKVKLRDSDTMDFMGGKGNVGYLWNYLGYFKKKLEDEIAHYKESDAPAHLYCPNFAAWLRIYTELICNKLLIELHHAEKLQKKIKCYFFGPAVKEVIKITERKIAKNRIKKNEFEKLKKALKAVSNLTFFELTAAKILLQINGIENALEYIEGIKRKVGKMKKRRDIIL